MEFLSSVSGPLLDRIDIHIDVPPVPYTDLAAPADGETSAVIRARVNAARQRQQARFRETDIPHNAAMGVREIRQYCQLDMAGKRLLEQAMQHFGLSARAHDRMRKVRWRAPLRIWRAPRRLRRRIWPKRFSIGRWIGSRVDHGESSLYGSVGDT